MAAAQSTDFGHRVEQVWHETHCQMDRARIAESQSPSCSNLMILVGGASMCAATGHPAVHFPH
jgi:hypothetical protein